VVSTFRLLSAMSLVRRRPVSTLALQRGRYLMLQWTDTGDLNRDPAVRPIRGDHPDRRRRMPENDHTVPLWRGFVERKGMSVRRSAPKPRKEAPSQQLDRLLAYILSVDPGAREQPERIKLLGSNNPGPLDRMREVGCCRELRASADFG